MDLIEHNRKKIAPQTVLLDDVTLSILSNSRCKRFPLSTQNSDSSVRYPLWLFELYHNPTRHPVCLYCYRNLHGYPKKHRELRHSPLKEKNSSREAKCNLYSERFGSDALNTLLVLCKCTNGIKGVSMTAEEYL